MEYEYKLVFFISHIAWASAGALFSIHALIEMRRIKNFNWWLQVILEVLDVAFVLWVVTAYYGFIVDIAWQLLLVLIASSYIVFPCAIGLLTNEKNNNEVSGG